MSGPREPDDVLQELGDALRAAWAREEAGQPARPRRRAVVAGRRRGGPGRLRWALVACLGALALGPAAVATRDQLRADPLPALPAELAGPGGGDQTEAVVLARGEEQGVGWRLSGRGCAGALALFLSVPGGGAGTTCAASGAAVQTYYEAGADRTWVFGALPADVVRVEAAGRRVPVRPPDPATAARGIPATTRLYVLALPGARPAPTVVAVRRDGSRVACAPAGCGPTPDPIATPRSPR